ncbi:alpha/beta fold hydrolase [Nocardia sp. CA-135398]|uniref:alpha/beta fold hydrolase n=1 Tax=Nocardia sp. CA-135398 TaxID=3239977 RepID=UPI003D96A2AB
MSTYLSDAAEDLSVDGPSARFTYRRIGPRGGVPLVLLNRFRGTIDWWDPQLLDHLAAEHDVIVFDDIGVGYTTGEPRDSIEGFADGAIEFIQAIGLAEVDLLGWTLGGNVAQQVALRRPDLVRKLIVAASTPGGSVPGAQPPSEKVRATFTKPDITDADLVYLFFPETDAGRTAGYEYLARVSTRLTTGRPNVSQAAVQGQFAAIAKIASTPSDEVRANLQTIKHPVLYANGIQDAMTPAMASYFAVQHLESATLLLYSDAGHAFLFQNAEKFASQVTNFLTD